MSIITTHQEVRLECLKLAVHGQMSSGIRVVGERVVEVTTIAEDLYQWVIKKGDMDLPTSISPSVKGESRR